MRIAGLLGGVLAAWLCAASCQAAGLTVITTLEEGTPQQAAVDVEQAWALGARAVELALAGHGGVMPTIVRLSDVPYQWTLGMAALEDVANVEKFMPKEFISAEGFHITDACRRYLAPLIQGEAWPPFVNGLPHYVRLQNRAVPRQLPPFSH